MKVKARGGAGWDGTGYKCGMREPSMSRERTDAEGQAPSAMCHGRRERGVVEADGASRDGAVKADGDGAVEAGANPRFYL